MSSAVHQVASADMKRQRRLGAMKENKFRHEPLLVACPVHKPLTEHFDLTWFVVGKEPIEPCSKILMRATRSIDRDHLDGGQGGDSNPNEVLISHKKKDDC